MRNYLIKHKWIPEDAPNLYESKLSQETFKSSPKTS